MIRNSDQVESDFRSVPQNTNCSEELVFNGIERKQASVM